MRVRPAWQALCSGASRGADTAQEALLAALAPAVEAYVAAYVHMAQSTPPVGQESMARLAEDVAAEWLAMTAGELVAVG